MATKSKKQTKLTFSPEALAYIQQQIEYVPGMNNSTDYKREGMEAQRTQETERVRRQEANSTKEMRPVLKRKATLQEQLEGKKDEYTYVPHGIGMSGADPLASFFVGNAVLNQPLRWLGKGVLYGLGRFARPTDVGQWATAKLLSNQMQSLRMLEGYLPIVPRAQIRTKYGDVEIDNPELYYHQSEAGKARNFIQTGRMRTPTEEYWMKQEHVPLLMRTGIVPGFPQNPTRAMFSRGDLWFGLNPRQYPDLLVTAKEMPFANSKAGVINQNASLSKLEGVGRRRVTSANVGTMGPHTPENTSAYTWVSGYGYRRIGNRPRTLSWGKAQTIIQDNMGTKKKFKSELDWRPKSWFSTRQGYGYDMDDILALKRHIPEYLEIEKLAKANGTWLKMPDGSIWKGDPRSWVQLMSTDGQKLVPERNFGAVAWQNPSWVSQKYPEWEGESWLSNSEEMAKKWSGQHEMWKAFLPRTNKYFEITYPKKSKKLLINANNAGYAHIPNPFRETGESNTNQLVQDAVKNGYDITQIDNVVEGTGDLVNDVVIHDGIPRKSLLGNNGNFDFNVKNIYKGMILPISWYSLKRNE